MHFYKYNIGRHTCWFLLALWYFVTCYCMHVNSSVSGFIQFWGFKDLHRPWRYLENFQRFVRDEISTSTNIIRHQSFVYNCRLIHFNFLMQYNVVIHRVITGKKFSPSIYLEVCISIYYVHFIPRGAWRVFKWRALQKLMNYGNSS